MTQVKLTDYASSCGCGAKLGPDTLANLLTGLPRRQDEHLLVGYDKSDDASVYQINEELALVQTVDFFPPLVDDPYLFGQIAATNALSDVYAMGGEAKLALNIVGANVSLGAEVLRETLRGGYDKAYEAGVMITGGHTIHDAEPKYGLAVTGFVRPDRLLRNDGVRPGDALLLTKPLGVGILMGAARGGLVSEALLKKLYAQMCQLNKYARDVMVHYDVHSCTDVTGFGLLGHACEMADASQVTLHFNLAEIPYHPEAVEMAAMGLVPEGAYRNRRFAAPKAQISGIEEKYVDLLCDPQTSGGLMIAVAAKDAVPLEKALQATIPCAKIIGYAEERAEKSLIINP